MSAQAKHSLVIVGAGMAGAYLIDELSRREHAWDITVVGDEPRPCYNRVLLSSLLAGEIAAHDLSMLPDNCTARFINHSRIGALDTAAQQLHCEDGRRIPYDAAVLATGAQVALPMPELPPADNIHAVRTEEDVDKLRALAHSAARHGETLRALVIGGGLLGLEAAHGLNALGMDTLVIHRNDCLMNRQLDSEGGTHLRRTLEARGLRIQTGVAPREFRCGDDSQVTSVRLDDGSERHCDLVVLATGIQPNVSLALASGLQCDRGVVVDAQLRTSDARVFALGECCQYGAQTFGLVAPIRAQAAALAAALCAPGWDARTRNTDVPPPGFCADDWPVQLKISGVDIFRTGELDPRAEQITLRDPRHGVYRRLVVRDERLLGALLVGDRRGSTWYAQLIKDGADISELRTGLMFGREVAEALANRSTRRQHTTTAGVNHYG